MRSALRNTLICVAFTLCSLQSNLAFGQGIVGTIFGTVTDASGAVVPDATVVLRNIGTHEVRNEKSDSAGRYRAAILPPGTYLIEVTKPGFELTRIENLQLFVKQEREVDVTLEPGRGTTEITVTAAAVALDTENASQSQVITAESTAALPLNGQNYVALTSLAPGATPSTTYAKVPGPAGAGVADAGGRSYTSVSIGGNRQQDMTYTYDGVESKSYWDGNVALFPPPEAIEEFKVQQGYVSPEFGPPVVVNVITKSGQDTLHGSVFEFLRNDKLNARNYFAETRPNFRMNQFGAVAGGRFPYTNKHHWFASYEGLRLVNPTVIRDTVPSAQQLGGDFTDLVPFSNGGGCPYDPGNFSGNCLPTTTSQIIDPITGTGFTTPNMIPSNRINSLEHVMAPFFSPPNQPMSALGNYYLSSAQTQTDDQFSIRTDHTLSSADTLNVRFSYSNSRLVTPGDFKLSGSVSPINVRNLGVGWTHIFRPNLVNTVRGAYSETKLLSGVPSTPVNPASLGIQNAQDLSGVGCVSLPTIGISLSSGFPSNGGNCYGGLDKDITFYDNLAWVHGKHSLSFGTDIRRVSHLVTDQLYLDGNISFLGAYSGNSIADFVLGAPSETLFGVGRLSATNVGWWMSFYANDDYHVTSKLTVNLGLRYTNNQVLVPQQSNYTWFDPTTGLNLHPPQDGLPPGVANRANLDFAPRVGFAYQATKYTVIRSSYGVYFVDDPGDDLSFNYGSPPTFTSIDTFASAPGALTATVNQGLPTDIVPSASILASIPENGTPGGTYGLFTRERDRHTPYIQTWNLTIERALPWHMLIDAAYSGNEGTHLSKRVDINTASPLTGPACGIPPIPGCDPRSIDQRRPYPNWGSIFFSGNHATSNYNALQLQLQKAPTQGVFFTAAYTYGKAIDEDEYGNRNYSRLLIGSDRALASYDRRQIFSAAVTLTSPFGTASGIRGQLLGSWELASINSFVAGSPFTPRTSADYANIGQQYGFKRPDRICDGNLPASQRSLTEWFNTSCFVKPINPFPHLGDSGFNILDGPGYMQTDLSLSRDFKLHERLNLQFRADFFNFVNHTNFGVPGNNLNSATFGKITSALDPREGQVALKLKW